MKPAFISQRQTEEPPTTWDTSGISGNVFAHPQASSSAPYPQGSNSTWKKTIEEPIHMSTAEKSGRPERDPDLRCQSGPSAKDSVIFSGGDSSKNYGADQQRLQISDLHFDKFPTPATFACWKIRFKTEVCTCSQFPTEAMQWIKEVELVDSVDELRSSSSTRGISMPNFEVLDARIASALNKIIHNSHFKKKISLEEQKAQKEDRFLRGRQIAYLIYEQFRVTGIHDSVENYTDLFTFVLRNDDIQEFDSKWDGILLSMTKIPHDDILEGLYKLRIRESEKLKTVLELYDLETHQKKLGPDYHTWQVADVRRPLVSASHIQAGSDLFIGKDEAYIMNRMKEKSMLRKEGNVYVLDLFVRAPPNVTAPVTYTPMEVDAIKLQTRRKRAREASHAQLQQPNFLTAGRVSVEDRSKRAETVRPQLGERCEKRREFDSVLSATKR